MFQHGEHCIIFFHDHGAFGNWLPPDKSIPNAKKSAQIIVSLSTPTREKVDKMIEGAIKAGGKLGLKMAPDEAEFGMYTRSVEDPDGHVLKCFSMRNMRSHSQIRTRLDKVKTRSIGTLASK